MLFELLVRCSAGGHGKAQTVTWTGVLNSRRSALGLKIDWAYGPGEVKILTSSDGANFEEARCWQPASRTEVAYVESFLFDVPKNVKAVTISMRAPLSWGYFGINSVALLAEPGSYMLVRLVVDMLLMFLQAWLEKGVVIVSFLFCVIACAAARKKRRYLLLVPH